MLLERILSQIAPYACLVCSKEGRLVCDDCVHLFATPTSHCYRCNQPTADSAVCAACAAETPLSAVRAAVAYQGHAKQLVLRLKYSSARAATTIMAERMAPLLSGGAQVVLVPVPTTTARVRQRGYDQAVLLARALARKHHLHYHQILRRLGEQHQVGANRAQRKLQLQGAYYVAKPSLVIGMDVILVDDVTTTGATLESAARAVMQAGAKTVSAIVFAQA